MAEDNLAEQMREKQDQVSSVETLETVDLHFFHPERALESEVPGTSESGGKRDTHYRGTACKSV